MPRTTKIANTGIYRGYEIKARYEYDVRQLNKIIDALEFYSNQAAIDKTSDYVVFDITIKVTDTTASPFFDPYLHDDGYNNYFNVNDLKNILSDEYFYYRWTREWSQKNQEHYHLMVIANHLPKTEYMASLHQSIMDLSGVKSVFISPRQLNDYDHRNKVHFHWLHKDHDDIDGLNDAINRHSYRAKLDQKINGVKRTFDGCRALKPLRPISSRLQSLKLAS